MLDYVTLKVIWWGVMCLVLIAFAITGGIDIGVNLLLTVIGKDDKQRRLILNAIGPTWEGNQVWLVTFGAGLFAIWPTVYATAFSVLYSALMIALLMLILRPPGFDYRSKIASPTWRKTWDTCLFVGSVVLSIIFGVAIGNLFIGLDFNFTRDVVVTHSGGFFSLLSPFPLLCGMVSIFMFMLQGALFLNYKLPQEFHDLMYRVIRRASYYFSLSFVIAGVYACLLLPGFTLMKIGDLNTALNLFNKSVAIIPSGWLNNYMQHPWLWVLPLIALSCARAALKLVKDGFAVTAIFVNSLGIAATVMTAACALFPFILPSHINPAVSLTIWDACSSYNTLAFALVALCILLPIILVYTAWVYRVMRGKVVLSSESY